MSDPDRRPLPVKMLALYRQRSPLEINDAAKAFLRMARDDRDELLFYMVSHITVAMQQRDDAPGRTFEDIDKYLRGGDA